jgi:hypothetical protein
MGPSKDRQSPIDLNDRNPNQPTPDKGPGDTRPYLCIPYWEIPRFAGDPVDIGQVRPLPAGVISWDCPGIHTTPYVPGQDLQVKVDVRNSGLGSATVVATVLVYWADPTVGFAHPTFFGATTVAAPTIRDPMVPGFVSATLNGVIPASAPNHVCLLVCVTHSLDVANAAADPIGDRHWAQRNLFTVTTKLSPIIVSFLVANPFETQDMFDLQVRTLDLRELELFAMRMKFEPSEIQPRMQLLDDKGRPVSDLGREAQARLALGPHGRRRYSIVLHVEQHLPAHQLTAVEVILYQNKDQQRAVGSLGIVIFGDDVQDNMHKSPSML